MNKISNSTQIMMKKHCSSCKELLELSFFRKDVTGKNGIGNICKKCNSRAGLINYYKNKTNIIKEKGIWFLWSKNAITGHKNKGYVILFSISELEQKAKNSILCSLCHIKIDWDNNSNNCAPNRPTLENINLKKELKLEDTEITCRSCNTTKGSRTKKEFIDYCRDIYLKNSTESC